MRLIILSIKFSGERRTAERRKTFCTFQNLDTILDRIRYTGEAIAHWAVLSFDSDRSDRVLTNGG